MAPLCSAGRPTSSYPRLCFHTFYLDICVLFILVLASRLSENNALITYDRLTLLNLRPPLFHEPELHWDLGDATLLRTCPSTRTFCLPPPSLFKRRSRKRGKWSGLRVRLKALLKVHAAANSFPIPDFLQFPFTSHRRPSFKLLSHRRICPVGLQLYPTFTVLCSPLRTWSGTSGTRAQHRHLSKLRRASVGDEVTKSRMALLNTRSLVNKTFILNDLFLTLHLDVLFLTETWIRPGEFSPSLNSFPLTVVFSAHRDFWGRAAFFKDKLKLRRLPPPTSSSFVAQLLELTGPSMTLRAVIYRPPKYNKSFIPEFADFLASLFLNYDVFLFLVILIYISAVRGTS